jgi:hypothetical protein
METLIFQKFTFIWGAVTFTKQSYLQVLGQPGALHQKN